MNIGMLWFDNEEKKTLQEKIERAAAYYEKKYGVRPNKVLVHPKQLAEVNGFTVMANQQILLHHLWLGVEHGG